MGGTAYSQSTRVAYGIAFRSPDQVTITSRGCNRLYTINQEAFAG